MVTFSLQSGSNGNCIYVEAGDARLLFDAGISGSIADQRMAAHNRNIRDCHALILSHDHTDHSSRAGIFHRRFGLPLYMTPAVRRAIRPHVGRLRDVRYFAPGDAIAFGDVTVRTLPTPHDGIDTVAFIVEHDDRRLGILNDLGHPFPALIDAMGELDAAYLESNFDVDMLRHGSYPAALKRRIAGDAGHLSNDDAADLVCCCRASRLKWIAASHISQENNLTDLAIDAHKSRIGSYFDVHVAPRHAASEMLTV